jgi:hypothetical protein
MVDPASFEVAVVDCRCPLFKRIRATILSIRKADVELAELNSGSDSFAG